MSDFTKLYENIECLTLNLLDIIDKKFGKKYVEIIKKLHDLSLSYQKDNTLDFTIEGFISELNEIELEKIIKIFTIQFELLNVAENTHRIRRKIYYENFEADKIQAKSFKDVFSKLYSQDKTSPSGERGVNLENMVQNLKIDLVMTAHPTEPKRKVIMKKLIYLSQLLIQRERGSLLKRDREIIEKNIKATVELIFETDFIRTFKLTPKDEIKSLLLFFEEVFIDFTPDLYQDIKSSYKAVTNKDIELKNKLINFGSWVGGDMDGNPYVNDQSITIVQ